MTTRTSFLSGIALPCFAVVESFTNCPALCLYISHECICSRPWPKSTRHPRPSLRCPQPCRKKRPNSVAISVMRSSGFRAQMARPKLLLSCPVRISSAASASREYVFSGRNSAICPASKLSLLSGIDPGARRPSSGGPIHTPLSLLKPDTDLPALF